MNKSANTVFFWNVESPLSNFHPSPFEFDGYQFFSSEQAFMYQKAKIFNDQESIEDLITLNNFEVIKKILNGTGYFQLSKLEQKEYYLTVKLAKNIGRRVQNYDDKIWNNIRYDKMKEVLDAKFSTLSFKAILLRYNKNSKFVEASPYDKIWGIGLCQDDAKKIPEQNWLGQNLLGKIITEIRKELN